MPAGKPRSTKDLANRYVPKLYRVSDLVSHLRMPWATSPKAGSNHAFASKDFTGDGLVHRLILRMTLLTWSYSTCPRYS